MTDRLHDHTTIGIRRGCVACAQLEADFSMAKRSTQRENAVGEALWEQAMAGDPIAVADYSHWLQENHPSEGGAGLHPVQV